MKRWLCRNTHPPFSILSFRTERSGVKNPGSIHVDVIEILRFALNDMICFYSKQAEPSSAIFHRLKV